MLKANIDPFRLNSRWCSGYDVIMYQHSGALMWKTPIDSLGRGQRTGRKIMLVVISTSATAAKNRTAQRLVEHLRSVYSWVCTFSASCNSWRRCHRHWSCIPLDLHTVHRCPSSSLLFISPDVEYLSLSLSLSVFLLYSLKHKRRFECALINCGVCSSCCSVSEIFFSLLNAWNRQL